MPLTAAACVAGNSTGPPCEELSLAQAFTAASSADPVDKEVCVREVINEAGRARETGLDCTVGKLANKLYTADHPGFVFPKKSVYANGQVIETGRYIERALASL